MRARMMTAAVAVAAAWPEAAAAGKAIGESTSPNSWLALGLGALFVVAAVERIAAAKRRKPSRAQAALSELAKEFSFFEWAFVADQTRAAVAALYAFRSRGDLGPAADRLTKDFRVSEQNAVDALARLGRRRVTILRDELDIRPLHVDVGDNALPYVWVHVVAKETEYVEEAATGRTVAGARSRAVKRDAVYLMIFDGRAWRIGAVDDGGAARALAAEPNRVDHAALRRNFGRLTALGALAFEAAPVADPFLRVR